MYIGEVSRQTGASPKAIRLYESLGLLPTIERKGRYRYFTENDIGLIQIIRQAKELGFRLAEIKVLLDEEVSCDIFPWEKAALLVKEKIENNDLEISRLEEKKIELNRFLGELEKNACS
ncbi:MAG: MerR family transcriptional regulator [Chloroflexi bacterium]|nr:MerR family transcriptional regulator [Chloroflexota bacterium]